MPTPVQIKNKLNECYAQCAITFNLRTNPQDSAFHYPKVHFDYNPRDGFLESLHKLDTELNALLAPPNPSPYLAKTNIIIVRDARTNENRALEPMPAGFAPGPVYIPLGVTFRCDRGGTFNLGPDQKRTPLCLCRD